MHFLVSILPPKTKLSSTENSFKLSSFLDYFFLHFRQKECMFRIHNFGSENATRGGRSDRMVDCLGIPLCPGSSDACSPPEPAGPNIRNFFLLKATIPNIHKLSNKSIKSKHPFHTSAIPGPQTRSTSPHHPLSPPHFPFSR